MLCNNKFKKSDIISILQKEFVGKHDIRKLANKETTCIIMIVTYKTREFFNIA